MSTGAEREPLLYTRPGYNSTDRDGQLKLGTVPWAVVVRILMLIRTC